MDFCQVLSLCILPKDPRDNCFAAEMRLDVVMGESGANTVASKGKNYAKQKLTIQSSAQRAWSQIKTQFVVLSMST